MRFTQLHYEGGLFFMTALTILALLVIVMSVRTGVLLFGKKNTGYKPVGGLNDIVQVGLFALVFGIFAQCISLFSAFIAIEEAGDVSFALIIGGLKVSMITTIYGFIIFLVSCILWYGLKAVSFRLSTND